MSDLFSAAAPGDSVPLADDAQEAVTGSVMHHYRAALALRRAHPVLVTGAQSAIEVVGDVLRFTRGEGAETLAVAANLSDRPAEGLGAWEVRLAPVAR